MGSWNYVVTAYKPTSVTHSCVGNFTSPKERNLIIGKCTHIEIHMLTPQGLQLMLDDVPIYGRISTLELFRPHGEALDLLFIATETYKLCVLQWDSETSVIITRTTGDFSCCGCRPIINRQISIIDPDGRLICLYDGSFKVIPYGPYHNGLLKESLKISLENCQLLDFKFLFGCLKPTIAFLYQDNNNDARHVQTIEVDPDEESLYKGTWSCLDADTGAEFLIPVPQPLGGVIIVGQEKIVYCRSDARFETIMTRFTRAYGVYTAYPCSVVLGDHAGHLHLLYLKNDRERVTSLQIFHMAENPEISIASTLSFLDNFFLVYVGSSVGDSQLIKLNHSPGASVASFEVLERYINLGPIVDFCVVDLERQGQSQGQTSLELPGIKGMWSLRASTDDTHYTFLVVNFISETRIFAMKSEHELEETEIEGFDSKEQSFFCHNAVNEQLVQLDLPSILRC